MSELIDKTGGKDNFRWQLLTTVSALALCGTIYTSNAAKADDADHPTVWVELGGQLERVQSKQEPLLPPFLRSLPRPGFEALSPSTIQTPPRYAMGGEAKITFAPQGLDWSFLAGVRFGRSNGSKHVHQQTTEFKRTGVDGQNNPEYWPLTSYGDAVTAHAERHLVIDFMAGRDVGLGFGRDSTATFDFGVRFAQFSSRTHAAFQQRSDPFVERIPQPPNPFLPDLKKYITNTHHRTNYAQDSITRSFSGIGPSLSLTGSSPMLGDTDEVQVAFDWGVNAAVLFGRQKIRGSHSTKGGLFTNFGYVPKSGYARPAVPVTRSRSRVVPNIGGLAGLTFRHADAKVSFGYRADFFFGAMDGGIDVRDTSTTSFHGPFATISFGLGG